MFSNALFVINNIIIMMERYARPLGFEICDLRTFLGLKFCGALFDGSEGMILLSTTMG